MIDAKIDVPLLRKQRDFLLEYPWRENAIPEEVEGLVNLIDHILDVEEGYAEVARDLRDMQIEFEVDERRTDLV
jgi:hypothetical protein